MNIDGNLIRVAIKNLQDNNYLKKIDLGATMMNIKQVDRLLNDIGRITIATHTSLEEESDLGESYYKVRLNNNDWEFLFIERERQNTGGESLIKTFDNEIDAIKFYYLFQLHRHFFSHYIQPFKSSNKDINIDRPGSILNDLKEALRRLNINTSYFSLDGKLKEHSIFLDKVNNEESKVSFIGQNGKVILSSLVLENWEIYSYMYRLVYYLYLFDQHYADLRRNKEIGKIFTDEDYKTLLVGR